MTTVIVRIVAFFGRSSLSHVFWVFFEFVTMHTETLHQQRFEIKVKMVKMIKQCE